MQKMFAGPEIESLPVDLEIFGTESVANSKEFAGNLLLMLKNNDVKMEIINWGEDGSNWMPVVRFKGREMDMIRFAMDLMDIDEELARETLFGE